MKSKLTRQTVFPKKTIWPYLEETNHVSDRKHNDRQRKCLGMRTPNQVLF